jgi:DNA-binding Lrp family transcriptional regulator
MLVSRHQKLLELLNRGARTAVELGAALGISRPAVSRLLAPMLRDQLVFRIGAARSSRYARVKTLSEFGGSHWPVYQVDSAGTAELMGILYALVADQYYFALNPEQRAFKSRMRLQSLYEGLPYFLQDQRPAGFMGRNVPQRFPELQLPQRVVDWTDVHYLRYFTEQGWDAVSDLIVGENSVNRFLASQVVAVSAEQRLQHFATQADLVTAGGLPGSSAHGEHPKFVTAIQDGGDTYQVLVKFSPPRHTELGQRWSDLLVAEHHAHVLLRNAGLLACESQVHVPADVPTARTFLEMRRFDRVAARGRVGVSSLLAIDTALFGQLDNWIAAAQRLHRAQQLSAADLRSVQFLSTFGELIANTDRHFGNLALFDQYQGTFTLAPAYDMLPMLYAPSNEQLVERPFIPPPPRAATLPVWTEAHALASRYWRELAGDQRVSAKFRQLCASCLAALAAQ